ncbi:hypothetical protein BD770DRAFT_440972 [Pilaira anomala]|nr:hypothetical protein BD770DRAFT_440972 [Pilaira anomala]
MSKRKISDCEEENEISDTTQVPNTFEGSELNPDTLFNNLNKLQKEINKLILSDIKFKLVVDSVRRKQAAKILDFSKKLYQEEEKVGVNADIEAKKIETDKAFEAQKMAIVALQQLLKKAEHDIAVLTKDNQDEYLG